MLDLGDLLLQILDLLDGRHATIRLFRELAFHRTTCTFRATGSFRGVALHLPFSTGITAGILPPLTVGPLLGLKSRVRNHAS
jgi:hypothetical protein